MPSTLKTENLNGSVALRRLTEITKIPLCIMIFMNLINAYGRSVYHKPLTGPGPKIGPKLTKTEAHSVRAYNPKLLYLCM